MKIQLLCSTSSKAFVLLLAATIGANAPERFSHAATLDFEVDGFSNAGPISEFNNRAVRTDLPIGDYRISIASGVISLCGGGCNITAISFRLGETGPIFDLGVLDIPPALQEQERYWDDITRSPEEAFNAYLSSGNTHQDVSLQAPAELLIYLIDNLRGDFSFDNGGSLVVRVEEIGPVGIAFLEFSINHAVLRFHTQETDASDETGVTSVGCAQNKRSGTPCGAPAGEDAVLLKGWFVLGQDSDGIDPLTEDITVTVGSYQLTIPAGSFTQKRGYRYQGILAGAEVFAWLREQGHDEYTFLLKIKDVDLAGSANPVTIGLAIGNDSGAREQRLQGVLRTHRPGKSKR